MILVDSSVWIDHLRQRDGNLERLLSGRKVIVHPFVIGEIAVGSIKDREVVLDSLRSLTRIMIAHDEEVLRLISNQRLFGIGVGYMDAHLLAAVRLTPGTLLWTRDKRLLAAADRLKLAFTLDS